MNLKHFIKRFIEIGLIIMVVLYTTGVSVFYCCMGMIAVIDAAYLIARIVKRRERNKPYEYKDASEYDDH